MKDVYDDDVHDEESVHLCMGGWRSWAGMGRGHRNRITTPATAPDIANGTHERAWEGA